MITSISSVGRAGVPAGSSIRMPRIEPPTNTTSSLRSPRRRATVAIHPSLPLGTDHLFDELRRDRAIAGASTTDRVHERHCGVEPFIPQGGTGDTAMQGLERLATDLAGGVRADGGGLVIPAQPTLSDPGGVRGGDPSRCAD